VIGGFMDLMGLVRHALSVSPHPLDPVPRAIADVIHNGVMLAPPTRAPVVERTHMLLHKVVSLVPQGAIAPLSVRSATVKPHLISKLPIKCALLIMLSLLLVTQVLVLKRKKLSLQLY